MHDCWLTMHIYKKDGEAIVSRNVRLPVVPVVGWLLRFHNDEGEQELFRVHDVLYDSSEDFFELTEDYSPDGESWCHCKPGDNCCILDLEDYEKRGWEIDVVRRGYDRRKHFDAMFEPEKWFETDPERFPRPTE